MALRFAHIPSMVGILSCCENPVDDCLHHLQQLQQRVSDAVGGDAGVCLCPSASPRACCSQQVVVWPTLFIAVVSYGGATNVDFSRSLHLNIIIRPPMLLHRRPIPIDLSAALCSVAKRCKICLWCVYIINQSINQKRVTPRRRWGAHDRCLRCDGRPSMPFLCNAEQ